MTRAIAKIAHQIPDRPPLQLDVGDEVRVGEQDSAGREGSVPLATLDLSG